MCPMSHYGEAGPVPPGLCPSQSDASSVAANVRLVPLFQLRLVQIWTHTLAQYRTVHYHTLLYSTILYCTILYHALLYYSMLWYTILYCTLLHYSIHLQGGRVWSECFPRGSHRCRVHDTRGKVATRTRTKETGRLNGTVTTIISSPTTWNSGITCPLPGLGTVIVTARVTKNG